MSLDPWLRRGRMFVVRATSSQCSLVAFRATAAIVVLAFVVALVAPAVSGQEPRVATTVQLPTFGVAIDADYRIISI